MFTFTSQDILKLRAAPTIAKFIACVASCSDLRLFYYQLMFVASVVRGACR